MESEERRGRERGRERERGRSDSPERREEKVKKKNKYISFSSRYTLQQQPHSMRVTSKMILAPVEYTHTRIMC